MKKFEVTKPSDIRKINEWFDYCSKQQIPYIIVKPKTKYSSIEWDYINLKPENDKVLDLHGEKNKELFIEIFKKYADKKSEYLMSNVTLFVKNIPNENSRQFAEEIFDVIHREIN